MYFAKSGKRRRGVKINKNWITLNGDLEISSNKWISNNYWKLGWYLKFIKFNNSIHDK